MTRAVWGAAAAMLLLGGCAVIPLGPVRVPDAGGGWSLRAAGGGDPAAAMWGEAAGEAGYAISCGAPGTLQLMMPADRPSADGRWTLAVGGTSQVVVARHDPAGPGTERATLATDTPLARALARGGGPLSIRAGGGEAVLPASSVVAEVVRACAGG